MATFQLIKLPYAADALAPVISAETIGFHHGKHLAGYVNNLNNLLPGSGLEDKSLVEIIATSEGAIFNNAGQILNHNLYFEALKPPTENNVPTGNIAKAIDGQFGSFENFKKEFSQKAATLFGSGWAWLSSDKTGKLLITQEPNAATTIGKGLKPLLTFDVWEHAYYLDYQNRRADYIAGLWSIINWNVVEIRYNA